MRWDTIALDRYVEIEKSEGDDLALPLGRLDRNHKDK